MTKKELKQKLNDSYEIINTALDANAELVHSIKILQEKNKDQKDFIDALLASSPEPTTVYQKSVWNEALARKGKQIEELEAKCLKDVLDLIDTRIAHTSSVTGAMELIDLKEDIDRLG